MWNSVSSSNVDAIMYDTGTLYVRFKSGDVYQYDGVPIDVYLDFLSASSKGHYHHDHVKWSYPYKKIS